ncbi:MAG: transglutaminase domain-containing protein [Euryarchaeota archaeon]|nr:transglutaminase domain-containing protein [Euryarchaeota archaeon]
MIPERVQRLSCAGEFRRASREIDLLLEDENFKHIHSNLRWEKERMRRLRLEYSISEKRARQKLARHIGKYSETEFQQWLREGALDSRVIDSRLRFFNRFAENLIFYHPELKSRVRKKENAKLKSLLANAIVRISTGDVRKYRIRAGIKVQIKKRVPGDKFRAWLPFPRESMQVEKVRLINASPQNYYISNEKQRTIYFESPHREFEVEFEYIINEVHGGIEGAYAREHLKEREPHILITPFIKRLAMEIVGEEQEPAKMARKIYDWITTHMRYFYVRNYGTYENIGEYAATNLRGDCGFHAILFITLCRAVGIPAKWQSGWFVTPHYAGPHDWAQVFLDGKWYPVDASFGNLNRHGKLENEFYFGSMDAFRMIANDDLLTRFDPPKLHWRSDPVDNQVGEVETESGNVYYGRYSWKIYLREFQRV